jgi:polar amino acid transport system permease protein
MFEILSDNWLLLLIGQWPHGPIGGLVATVSLALASLLLAFPLGVLLALGRISTHKIFYWPSTAVVYLVRGLPLIMFIFWAYFFLPLVIGTTISGAVTMVVALALYEGAYLSEIIRSGIQALPAGQMEAGRSLGLTHMQTMRKIVLPQALYNTIPSMLSQFISTVKETSLGFVISVHELTFAASQINNILLTKPFQVFALLALTYFVLNLILTGVVKLVERRMSGKRPVAA